VNLLAIPARLRMLAALLGGHLRAAWNLAAPPLPPRRHQPRTPALTASKAPAA
jgi:hypothetical protein